MGTDITVVGISGSRRRGSHTKTAVSTALATSEAAGAQTELIELRSVDVPLLDPDVEEPGEVADITQRLRNADGIILGTPMYHGSYSGVLKNTIDHCGFDEFSDKTVGLLAVSGGRFPVSALDHLRSVCRSLNAWVLPYEAAIPQADSVIAEGSITDETLAERVERLGNRVVEYAVITPHQESFEGDENVGG